MTVLAWTETDVERDLEATRERLRRIVQQADACLSHLQGRERLTRRVRAAARRRAGPAFASA